MTTSKSGCNLVANSKLLQWNLRVYNFIEDFDLGMVDEWLPHGDEAAHDVSEWLSSLCQIWTKL